MRLTCPSCGTEFSVDDSAVPSQGTDVPCPGCKRQVRATWPAIELDLGIDAVAALSESAVPAPSVELAARPVAEPPRPARPPATSQPSIQVVAQDRKPGGSRFVLAVAATALVAGGLGVLRWCSRGRDIAP